MATVFVPISDSVNKFDRVKLGVFKLLGDMEAFVMVGADESS
jgi:hypothetical protein